MTATRDPNLLCGPCITLEFPRRPVRVESQAFFSPWRSSGHAGRRCVREPSWSRRRPENTSCVPDRAEHFFTDIGASPDIQLLLPGGNQASDRLNSAKRDRGDLDVLAATWCYDPAVGIDRQSHVAVVVDGIATPKKDQISGPNRLLTAVDGDAVANLQVRPMR